MHVNGTHHAPAWSYVGDTARLQKELEALRAANGELQARALSLLRAAERCATEFYEHINREGGSWLPASVAEVEMAVHELDELLGEGDE